MDLIPSKETFELVQTLNLNQLEHLPKQQVRLVLPCLVRMCLCNSLDVSNRWKDARKQLKKFLFSIYEVNNISPLLEFKYIDLEAETKREMQLRFKHGSQESDSFLLKTVNELTGQKYGQIKYFELFGEAVKIRIVLYELILLMSHFRNLVFQPNNNGPYPSELFDADIYLDEICDLLYFTISEMPNIFQLIDVVDSLLIVKNGLKIICCLIANFPDSFHEICMALINNGGNCEEDSYYSINRIRVLRSLCLMNPKEALLIRGEAVELCRMPNLVVMLTLDHVKQIETKPTIENDKSSIDSTLLSSKTDIISFITGILLSNDDKVRTWFSQYIKLSQKKTVNGFTGSDLTSNSFCELRIVLLDRFKEVTELVVSLANEKSKTTTDSEQILTEACIMLRLYCALRGVASMKFTDEENFAICRMIATCKPPHSYIGVRFVSFGLCMILAFPQLVTVPENEDKIIEWIKWLVQEESYLGKVAGMKSSFGEMLLLIAIHFHSNQMTAIGELVSSTIGIKLPIRINDLNRIKNIFTQKIFPEQTVAAHAVKVPVTKNLSNSVSGFLPVHCIFQLLKSRAFTKNKVPIKDWIFKQIRNCVAPVHSMVPQLIEAYVSSILQPSSQSFHLTNEPISEAEIAVIFQKRVYSIDDDEQYESEEEDDESEDSDDDEPMEEDEVEDDEQSIGSKSKIKTEDAQEDELACVLTSQLLLLYYVLLYENMRLSNMKNIVNIDRKVTKYSEEFLAELPIFYLVQKTRYCQVEYGELTHHLLRLLAFHYPHLCLVKDWLPNTINSAQFSLKNFGRRHFSRNFGSNKRQTLSTKKEREKFLRAFKSPKSSETVNYSLVNEAFERLLQLPDEYLWPLASDFVSKLSILLNESVPRVVTMNARSVWLRLNHIFPTKLWVMTVNQLNYHRNEKGRNFSEARSWSDIVMNPMFVLNCDRRVFCTPDLMDITLHILNGFLSASKIMSTHYLMEKPSKNLEEEKKREELRLALQSLTEATAIQCLLECCLLKETDFVSEETEEESDVSDEQEDQSTQSSSSSSTSAVRRPNIQSNLREVQRLICTHLHQCFIAEVSLAKLVHFEGYQRELLPLVVTGIPSMHICLDFLPELLNQLELDKQSFAMDLCSHLCIQYPTQRFFNVAKLCLAIAVTHLSVLPSERRATFYISVLPSLQRMCEGFPPLIDEFVKLLVQLAQKNNSRLSSHTTMNMFTSLESVSYSKNNSVDVPIPEYDPLSGQNSSQSSSPLPSKHLANLDWTKFEKDICAKLQPEEALSLCIHKAFAMLCNLGLISKVFQDQSNVL